MTKGVDGIQNAGNGQLDGMTLDFTTTLQAIFAEGADYTKKSVESRLALGEKLLGAKSLETVRNMPSRRTPTSSRRRRKWANSIPTSPRQPSSRRNRRSPPCKARSNRHYSNLRACD
jgi:hypothetical protein